MKEKKRKPLIQLPRIEYWGKNNSCIVIQLPRIEYWGKNNSCIVIKMSLKGQKRRNKNKEILEP